MAEMHIAIKDWVSDFRRSFDIFSPPRALLYTAITYSILIIDFYLYVVVRTHIHIHHTK